MEGETFLGFPCEEGKTWKLLGTKLKYAGWIVKSSAFHQSCQVILALLVRSLVAAKECELNACDRVVNSLFMVQKDVKAFLLHRSLFNKPLQLFYTVFTLCFIVHCVPIAWAS